MTVILDGAKESPRTLSVKQGWQTVVHVTKIRIVNPISVVGTLFVKTPKTKTSSWTVCFGL
jgi:hypothetical protein